MEETESLNPKGSGFWRGKNVFVTGCTGFIGSWLTKALVDARTNVVGLVRDVVPKSIFFREEIDKEINVIRGSLEDYSLIVRTLNEYNIDTVFHLAAQAIVGVSNKYPLSTFETNIRGTWHVVEACRNITGIKRIVIASSDKAYGDSKKLPYTEDMPLQGMHPYDASKSCADLISQAYFHTYRLPVSITRCSNIFGGGDLNFNRIIPDTIQALIKNQPPVIRSDGTPIRDYLYVEDAVFAYLTVAEKMEELNLQGEAFNFAYQNKISVLDIVKKIQKIMHKEDIPLDIQNRARCEIQEQYLSVDKARNLLQWQPMFTLEEGLKKTIEWYKDFFRENARP